MSDYTNIDITEEWKDQMEGDLFPNNTFSIEKWAPSRVKEREEAKKLLDSYSLIGKTISYCELIGHSYAQQRKAIVDYANSNMSEGEEKTSYENISPTMLFDRSIRIDEPFIIYFDELDFFGIMASREGEYLMSMSKISDMYGRERYCNIDIDEFFSHLKGKTIKDVNVVASDISSDTDSSISSLTIILEDDSKLVISAIDNFTTVTLVESNGERAKISFKELEPILFNYEDSHLDPVTGYRAKSPNVYFGEKSLIIIDAPYLTITTEDEKTELYIDENDYLLLGWAISIQINDEFWEDEDYEFSIEEWNGVLDHAQKIIDFKTFDDLFDYLIQFKNKEGKSRFLWALNNIGKFYWDDRMKYFGQLEDIKEWSKLITKDNTTFKVIGF